MTAPQNHACDVCVVGAGPVGLTAAMELASRGVDVIVIETRAAGEPPSVKSNHISARSMEIFRRLGVANDIRAQGLPDDYPNDVVYATRFTGHELTRFRMPCRRERFDDAAYDDGNLPSPERAARVSQLYLEPVLFAHATRSDRVRVLNRTQFESVDLDGERVRVHARSLATGSPVAVDCRYVIGCDGARSAVRRHLGIRLVGDDNLVRARSRLFRAPDLLPMCGYPRAWMNWFHAGGSWSAAIAIDGRGTWLMHCFLPDPSMAFEDFDVDAALRAALGVGADFRYEVIRDEDWVGRRLVADRWRSGPAFIAGDAAHQWVPYGGYGMNAGIADASGLAWMLAAVLEGWAPESILDAYEAERKAVTERVSRFAASFVGALHEHENALVEDETPEGERLRKEFGKRIFAAELRSVVPKGLNFGYCYEESPLVSHDGEAPPPFSMGEYTPSTVPGCRLPHFWLRDGRSLYDALGRGFTLLRFDPSLDVSPVASAAERHGVPFEVLDVEPGRDFDPSVYRHPLVLARPDQHVAWRAHAAPADGDALLGRIRNVAVTVT